MKRFFIIFFIILVILIIGITIYFRINSDKITAAISKAVESATGQPLHTDTIPSLSFFPTPGVELGKSTWGDPKHDAISISLTRCVFRVSLTKLFVGTIAINEVILDEPKIIIHKEKIQKVQSITSENSPSSKKDTISSFELPSVTIASFIIKDGTVTFIDGHKELLLTNVQAYAKNIYPQSTGKIFVQTNALCQPEGIALNAECTSSIIPNNTALSLENLKVVITPQKGLPVTSPITVTGNAHYIVNKNSFEVLNLQILIEQFTILANGSFNLNTMKGVTKIRASGSPKKLTHGLGFMAITPDPNVLENFSASTTAQINKTDIRLTDLEITLDDSQLSGNLNLNIPKSISGNLVLTSINLDKYLPLSIAQRNMTNKPIGQPPSNNNNNNNNTSSLDTTNNNTSKIKSNAFTPDVNVQLTADTILLSKLHIQKLHSQIKGSHAEYTLSPCTFVFYESPISIIGKGNFSSGKPNYEASITGNNINLATLLMDISNSMIVKEGHVGLSANIKASGSTSMQLKETLNGDAKLNGNTIVIQFGKIPQGTPELINLATETFTKLDGTLKATNGIITIEQLLLIGSPVTATATGKINLPQHSINVTSDIAMKNTVIPFHITGNLSNPSYKVDPTKIIQDAVTKIMNKKEKELINKMPLPNDAKETINDAAEKVFNKIFGR